MNDDDWIEFDKWFEENKNRFHHDQYTEKEIAFASYLAGMRWVANIESPRYYETQNRLRK